MRKKILDLEKSYMQRFINQIDKMFDDLSNFLSKIESNKISTNDYDEKFKIIIELYNIFKKLFYTKCTEDKVFKMQIDIDIDHLKLLKEIFDNFLNDYVKYKQLKSKTEENEKNTIFSGDNTIVNKESILLKSIPIIGIVTIIGVLIVIGFKKYNENDNNVDNVDLNNDLSINDNLDTNDMI